MARDPSVGELVGFGILIAVVLIFVIGVAIYAIYIQCCKKPSKKISKAKPEKKKYETKANHKSTNQNVVGQRSANQNQVVAVDTNAAGDVAWRNPLDDLENVLEEEDRKIEEASQLGSEIHTTDSGFQNGTLERQQPEILEEDPHYIRNSKVFATVEDVNETSKPDEPITPQPAPVLEVSKPNTPPIQSDAVTSQPEVSVPPSKLPTSRFDGSQPSVAMDTLERKEARDLTRSNSILDRVSYFESAQNSLVRPARGQKQLEGIKSKVVTGLVTDFEKSDNILLGRQAPEAGGDIHIMQQTTAPTTQQATDDPLYAVPDRNRKSLNRKPRPESRVSETSDQEMITPQVPDKPNVL